MAEKQSSSSSSFMNFNPLRSLRNIFFGYRRKGDKDDDGQKKKAKSTDDMGREGAGDSPTTKRDDRGGRGQKQSGPYGQQISVSADNLLGCDRLSWNPAPLSPLTSDGVTPKKNKTKQGSTETDISTPKVIVEDDWAQEFFTEKWSQGPARLQSVEGEKPINNGNTSEFDLLSIPAQGCLDVSKAKDKLAVKQKGKRVSTAFLHKMGGGATGMNFSTRSPVTSVAEDDEDENVSTKTTTTTSNPASEETSVKPTELSKATPGREGRPNPFASELSASIQRSASRRGQPPGVLPKKKILKTTGAAEDAEVKSGVSEKPTESEISGPEPAGKGDISEHGQQDSGAGHSNSSKDSITLKEHVAENKTDAASMEVTVPDSSMSDRESVSVKLDDDTTSNLSQPIHNKNPDPAYSECPQAEAKQCSDTQDSIINNDPNSGCTEAKDTSSEAIIPSTSSRTALFDHPPASSVAAGSAGLGAAIASVAMPAVAIASSGVAASPRGCSTGSDTSTAEKNLSQLSTANSSKDDNHLPISVDHEKPLNQSEQETAENLRVYARLQRQEFTPVAKQRHHKRAHEGGAEGAAGGGQTIKPPS
jgi:hypothetical protein